MNKTSNKRNADAEQVKIKRKGGRVHDIFTSGYGCNGGEDDNKDNDEGRRRRKQCKEVKMYKTPTLSSLSKAGDRIIAVQMLRQLPHTTGFGAMTARAIAVYGWLKASILAPCPPTIYLLK